MHISLLIYLYLVYTVQKNGLLHFKVAYLLTSDNCLHETLGEFTYRNVLFILNLWSILLVNYLFFELKCDVIFNLNVSYLGDCVDHTLRLFRKYETLDKYTKLSKKKENIILVKTD